MVPPPIFDSFPLEAIEASPGIVIVLGDSDTGKTTWIRHAAASLTARGCVPLAVVDSDIGQATLVPPASVSLRILHQAGDTALAWDSFSSMAHSL